MKRIAILASGEGTNAENIIRYFSERKTAKVVVVITNKAQAGVLNRADKLGIPTEFIPAQDFTEGRALEVLHRYQTDFIALAGFLLRVPDDIHPALLPKFGGKGMYGNRVHEAVIAAAEKESGITIHFINGHYDEGDTIFQATCPVMPNDTPETLAARVHALEYEHFPQVIEKILM